MDNDRRGNVGDFVRGKMNQATEVSEVEPLTRLVVADGGNVGHLVFHIPTGVIEHSGRLEQWRI